MKLAKIFLNGILCVALSALFLLGVGLISFNPNTTAKATDPIKINYWLIYTDSDIYAAYDNNTDPNVEDLVFTDVIYQESGRLQGFSTTTSADIQTVNATLWNGEGAASVVPTRDSQGTQAISTILENEDLDLRTSYMAGMLIGKKTGWLYDCNPMGIADYKLRSLTQISGGDNILPADFLEQDYSPKCIANNEIDLYCIINPFSVNIFPDDPDKSDPLGGFESETNPGEIDGNINVKTVHVAYKAIHTFETPKPYNPQQYRFDGYYTEPQGGNRVTDRYGKMNGQDCIYKDTGWVLGTTNLYGRFVPVFNVTYYYTYNNEVYKGDLQFETSEKPTRDTFDTLVITGSAINQTTNLSSPFPSDKVIAYWYTTEALTTKQNFPIQNPQNISLYAKLAETHYNVTFSANGGTFNDADSNTEKTYSVNFGINLDEAITNNLLYELGTTNPVAIRIGYTCNNKNWSKTTDGSPLPATSTLIEEDTIVYLIWYQKNYRIQYETDGTVSKQAENNVHYGDNIYDIVKNVTPVRTGYNFICWAYSTSNQNRSYTLTTRPEGKTHNYTSSITLTFIRNETVEADKELMPDNNIILYGVWIQAYTIEFSLNQGYPVKADSTPLIFKNNNIIITIENGENLGQALTRQQIGDFFTNANYFPVLPNCSFDGWYYYSDGNYTNNDPSNAYKLTNAILTMNINELKQRSIDLTKKDTIAAKYTYNKNSDPYYTEAPQESANTVFAIILMIISVILLVMLIMSHRGNNTLEINDKAINAYKQIYGEDAPLPTFKSTKPPFETGEEYEVVEEEQNNATDKNKS